MGMNISGVNSSQLLVVATLQVAAWLVGSLGKALVEESDAAGVEAADPEEEACGGVS